MTDTAEGARTGGPIDRLIELSRREFISRTLSVVGWGSFAAVLADGAFETVNFFYPRVVYSPPTTFRIGTPQVFLARDGNPDAYGVVFIDETFKPAERFFIVRAKDRVYALTARCAHLGCTVNWFPGLGIFKCPCHGSHYRSDGTNFAGPAPRPLDRLAISLSATGELVVNTALVYTAERAETDGAYVEL